MQVVTATSRQAAHVPMRAVPMPAVRVRVAEIPVIPVIPGPELPAIEPRHPDLPRPVPSLAALAALAANASPASRFPSGSHPSAIRNAHYTNTRSQLAYALAGPYNSIEGDVRIRDGVPVMAHDAGAPADLTFEQWALLGARAGRHLRIDLKESSAMPQVAAILQRLGIDSGMVTFNVGVLTPFNPATTSIASIRALRTQFPRAWVTLNMPLPLGPGYLLATRVAKALGPERLGVAITTGLAHAGDVRMLRRFFAVVNAWNMPQLGDPDVEETTARLRAMGVNGMIDLRRRDDPLAND